MRNSDIRTKLKEEFNSIVPNVWDKVLDAPFDRQPTIVAVPNSVFFPRKMMAYCCLVLFAIVLGVGFNNVYRQVHASISIDINPSISLDINRFDRVIDVKAYNREAESVVSGLNLKNATADSAINHILSSAQDKGYITTSNGENAILFSVWADNANDVTRLETSMHSHVGKHLSTNNINSEIRFEDIDSNIYHHAQVANVSSGKVKLVDDIVEYDSSFDASELLAKPVKELFEVYDNCRSGHGKGGTHNNVAPTNTPTGTQAQPSVSTPQEPQDQRQQHHSERGHGRGMHR